MDRRPIIAITMGDPVGIGPEITCAALLDDSLHQEARILVVGDPGALAKACKIIEAPLKIREISDPSGGVYEPGVLDVLAPCSLDPARLAFGSPSPETGNAMVQYVFCATDLAMAKKIHGMATGPIHKAAMHAAGFLYNGHTELLAQRTQSKEYVMMLAGSRLRVVLVTIHTALSQVPGAITSKKIVDTMRLTSESLRARFGISQPRLVVAALNPHAGEQGLFGDEETRVIAPAIAEARTMGIQVEGPLPSDTLFYHALAGKWDAVVCQYHDQGLIPFKMIHFTDGVNTTLGLPIIRTSVDHGTAYDIAGTGAADPGSLVAAVRMAALQARHLHGLG